MASSNVFDHVTNQSQTRKELLPLVFSIKNSVRDMYVHTYVSSSQTNSGRVPSRIHVFNRDANARHCICIRYQLFHATGLNLSLKWLQINIVYKKELHATNMDCKENSFPDVTHVAKNTMVVDLRSDTLTKPTKRMREAIFSAEVGDDVHEEDPTVKKLESKVAEMVGMEAAVFVPSGTMSNLIAIMNHCDMRGSEAYCNESAHCLLHEQGGASQLAGVCLRPLRNNSDGTFELRELQSKLRHGKHYEPISALVLAENTIDGKILPQSWLEKLVKFCKERNLKLHMDGARLWNVCVGSGKSAKEIVRGFDSVSVCLSKGLGAPVGSVLCGSRTFIAKARRSRKVLGGGMRQVGIIAAAGIIALEDTIPILKEDHRRAYFFASSIRDTQSTVFFVDLGTVHTNMVFVKVDSNVVSATTFASRLQEICDNDDRDKVIVKCMALNDSSVRFVFHYDITDSQLMQAIEKVTYIITKLDPKL